MDRNLPADVSLTLMSVVCSVPTARLQRSGLRYSMEIVTALSCRSYGRARFSGANVKFVIAKEACRLRQSMKSTRWIATSLRSSRWQTGRVHCS